MPRRLTAAQRAAVNQGWSASEVDPAELVDDAWIAAHTRTGKTPSRARHLGGRLLQVARSPRALKAGGLTRDQMRRIAARTGYPYVEAWSGHNRGQMRGVWGAMVHHTGTSWAAAGDYPTLRVVRDGRPGLENSLCGFGLGKSGTAYLINEKLSWHAGAGEYNGMTDGNGYTVGIEAESDGRNWTAEQRDAYPRLVASILIEIGQTDPRPNVGDKYTTRHASFALPRGRKTDAGGLDMDLFWRQVYGYLANPATIHKDSGKGPAPAPITPPPAPPAPPPAPAPARPGRFGWNLPTGHYYGHKNGPAASHGGYHAAERDEVRNIQQWLIFRGCVPGQTNINSGWADGLWEDATSAAMRTWFARYYPGQKFTDRCYRDDYQRLSS